MPNHDLKQWWTLSGDSFMAALRRQVAALWGDVRWWYRNTRDNLIGRMIDGDNS